MGGRFKWVTNPLETVPQAALAGADREQMVDPNMIIAVNPLACSFHGLSEQGQTSVVALEPSNTDLTQAAEIVRGTFD